MAQVLALAWVLQSVAALLLGAWVLPLEEVSAEEWAQALVLLSAQR
jgi:hypothetical protein